MKEGLILFVCVRNAGRSRMAEAFFNRVAERHRAMSAGTEPAERPHPEVVASMRQVGIELPETPGTLLTSELAGRAERVIGMGCNVAEACPALSVPLEDWDLPDPQGKNPQELATIRDEIERRVALLVTEFEGF